MAQQQQPQQQQQRSQQISVRPPPEQDMTAYHPGQAHWSIHNLPDILYILRPTEEHTKSRAKVPIAPFLVFGKQVRDFPMLPRQISSQVEGWRMEAWFRMDRRIQPQDFIDRMNPRCAASISSLQYRRYSFRLDFTVAAWGSGSSIAAVTREVLRHGIDPARNTTRGLTPGLVDPAKGEAAGRVPLPGSWIAHAHPSEWPEDPPQTQARPASAVQPQLSSSVQPQLSSSVQPQLSLSAAPRPPSSVQPQLSSSAAPRPPSSLTATFAACAQQPSDSNLRASLLTSFKASPSPTKSVKQGASGTCLTTPTKKRKRTEQSFQQEHAGHGGQATAGRVSLPPSTSRTNSEFPFVYPDPEEHELTGPRPNSVLTEHAWKAKKDDRKQITITYDEYLKRNNLTYSQLLEKQAKEAQEYGEAAERMRALRTRRVY
ncbi:hypothetical protein VTN77DRAFT_796 [Rasamsonia byssochlamydoides]|uniref:uncharacterized protein n=1 Tax=Rasamsonia byssochlamydoides TaxID=89139 RepID=UPI003743C939